MSFLCCAVCVIIYSVAQVTLFSHSHGNDSAQNDFTLYDLTWKVEAGHPITYSIALGYAISNTSIDFEKLSGMDQADVAQLRMMQMFGEMVNSVGKRQNTYSVVSTLDKTPQGNISVKMALDEESVGSPEAFEQSMLGGMALLQGEMTPDGTITSDYIGQQQRNLLALLFGLPGKPVKVGDTWPIDLVCIYTDASQFTVKKSEKDNRVTFTEVGRTAEGRPIAVLEYEIVELLEGDQTIPVFSKEPVPGSFTCNVSGRGEFLIDEGRWKQFSAVFTIKVTGIVTSDITQSFTLPSP